MKKTNGAIVIQCAFLSLALIMSACTKEKPYDKQYKPEVEDKKLIDENAEYLLITSTGATSRTSEDRPYWMGEPRIVKLRFTENSLEIIEAEQDSRFQTNTTNNKVLLEIPAEHMLYRCAKDGNGECTNTEEKVGKSEKDWKKLPNVKFDIAGTKMITADSLTVEFDKLFGGGCYSEVKNAGRELKIEKDAINIQIEKTYRVNLECISSIESFDDLFTKTISNTIVHHSLVKLDSMASKDFKAKNYTPKESNTFGFFDQTTRTLDTDFRATVDTENALISRWNPERTQIDYLLSDEFAKPENKLLRDATFKGVEKINASLKQAGAKFQITLNDAKGKQAGDIRYSMIVMVEDPIGAGLLGYGPSVKNPRTGEILSARTVMYPGVMRQQVMVTYNEVYNQKRLNKNKAAPVLVNPALMALVPTASQSANSAGQSANPADVQVINQKKAAKPISVISNRNLEKDMAQLQKSFDKLRINSSEVKALINAESIEESLQDKMKLEMFKSRNCFFPVNSLAMDSTISGALELELGEVTKPWHELSASEQEKVINVIMPEAWISTFIHEMGHNLGLRHNFEGSQDAENFYSEEELAAMGINHKIPYSSVMDYGASSLNELPAMGKYDIAALRFAYANKVAFIDESGAEVLVDTNSSLDEIEKASAESKLTLKPYGFCTDEHADANPGCNRFDEGTTSVEMVQFMIDEYNSRKFYLNRLDRRSFSMVDDLAHASSTSYRFFHIRAFFEGYERMKNLLSEDYDLDIDDPAIGEQYPFIKDIRDAAILSGQFFLDILQTPEVACAIAPVASPNMIIAVEYLNNLDKSSLDCYGMRLNPQYVAVAQAGSSMISKKSVDSTNSYLDQIDLRGTWTHKVLAAKYLFNRKLNQYSYDQIVDNYSDVAELSQSIFDVSKAIASNTLIANAKFETKDGQKFEIPMETNLNQNLIKAPLYNFIARVVGVPARESYLQETLLKTIGHNMISSPLKLNVANAEYVDAFSTVKMSTVIDPKQIDNNAVYLDVGTTRIVAAPSNIIAVGLINSVRDLRLLNAVGKEKIVKMIELKEKGTALQKDATRDEKNAFKLNIETLKKFASDTLPSEVDSIKLLSFLI